MKVPNPYTGVAEIMKTLHGFSEKVQLRTLNIVCILGTVTVLAVMIVAIVYILNK